MMVTEGCSAQERDTQLPVNPGGFQYYNSGKLSGNVTNATATGLRTQVKLFWCICGVCSH
jgi:hypothetical protein